MMETKKIKYPAVSFLPLIILLSLLCPLHAENNVRKCFVCTERDSPKCSGSLSPSDTELIKECPVGTGINGTAKGCQIIAWTTGELIHPKSDFLWRDCLYPTDLEEHGVRFIPNEDDPEGRKTGRSYGSPSGSVKGINERRRQLGIPLLPTCDISLPPGHGSSFVALYYHPSPEYWNLSNGISIEVALAEIQLIRNFNFTKLPNNEVVSCPKPQLRSSSVVFGWSVWMLLVVGTHRNF